MEHRRDRHVDIVGAQRGHALVRPKGAGGVQGMQHQLAVREVDAFRVSGGARRVEDSCHRPFVEIGEGVLARGLRKQLLVLPEYRQPGSARPLVAELDVPLDGLQIVMDLLDQGQEIVVHQDQAILGVVHGVENLLGGKADVHRVQHRTDHGYGEEAFQVAMAVPIQQRHDISGLDSRRRQGVGEPLDPLVERPIVVAQLVGVNDLLLGLMAHPRQQQILDQQWVVVGALRRRNYFCFQHGCTS
ncbi:hypothetical protein D9M69_520200 [compost metagenome]